MKLLKSFCKSLMQSKTVYVVMKPNGLCWFGMFPRIGYKIDFSIATTQKMWCNVNFNWILESLMKASSEYQTFQFQEPRWTNNEPNEKFIRLPQIYSIINHLLNLMGYGYFQYHFSNQKLKLPYHNKKKSNIECSRNKCFFSESLDLIDSVLYITYI